MAELLIPILLTFLTSAITVLVPYLLTMAIGAIRDERTRKYAQTVVTAAQQAIPTNDARYSWAAGELARRFPTLKQTQVRALIEAAVHAMKYAPVELPPAPAPMPPVEQQDGDEDENS